MPITVITRQQLAADAPACWARQYKNYRGNVPQVLRKEEIGKRLAALDNPTPEAVNAIIGNPTWTRLVCKNCHSEVETAAQLGSDPDWTGPVFEICLACAKAAVAALEEAAGRDEVERILSRMDGDAA